jgi:serine/threonine protein phosphatase PrpC
LEKYITNDNEINYELLLQDEILEADKILLDRMGRAAQFGGSTLCLVVVDITNKTIVCANVGDSRAIMRDTKGKSVELSEDHKPDRLEEMNRIRDNGGYISNKDGCWRGSNYFKYLKIKSN